MFPAGIRVAYASVLAFNFLSFVLYHIFLVPYETDKIPLVSIPNVIFPFKERVDTPGFIGVYYGIFFYPLG